MNLDAVKKAYRRYARIYDALFGAIFHPGRRAILKMLAFRPGDRVLEVGVGTGLSLPLYPQDVKVVGIDVSREMLEQARLKVRKAGLSNVEALMEMDAEAMTFPDASFDKVVAMYVVSVVPHPQRLVEEMKRVCRPGGDIFIVNHFRSRNPMLRAIEGLLSPLSKVAGFRPDMDLDAFLKDSGLAVVEVRRANLFGYWKVIHARLTEVGEETEGKALKPLPAS